MTDTPPLPPEPYASPWEAPDELEALFDNNRLWAQRMRRSDPLFFDRLANQQAPRYLWIGCSDSRVPANEIIGLAPGEVFVHRNVANQVLAADLNCQSVIAYAIENLTVAHIMVVGHYGCGGIVAALAGPTDGLVGHWLQQVEMFRHVHARRLDAITDAQEVADRMCELNVIEQVSQLTRLPSVIAAWERGQPLTLHGLIYGLHDGLLRNLGTTIDKRPETLNWRKVALRALWARPPANRPANR